MQIFRKFDMDSLYRVLMAEWLPKSYLLNQATILALGISAIVHPESVIQVQLVCSTSVLMYILILIIFLVNVSVIYFDYHRFYCYWNVFSNWKTLYVDSFFLSFILYSLFSLCYSL
jgi:hypothetical protein